jgi:hypothetical protein
MKICSKHCFSVWSFATQHENQLKTRGIQKMLQIDFEDVHGVTGWSTEDVLLLHKKTTWYETIPPFYKKNF